MERLDQHFHFGKYGGIEIAAVDVGGLSGIIRKGSVQIRQSSCGCLP
jgi:hypothetical protein